MDEPTTALDVVMQRQILGQLVELRERLGFSVIFITHDLSLLVEFSDRIAIMYGGRIVEEAPAQRPLPRPAAPVQRRAAALVPGAARPAPRADRHPRLAAGPVEHADRLLVTGTAAPTRSTRARRSPRSSSRPPSRATTRAARSRACATTPPPSPRPASSRSPCPWSCRSADPRPAPGSLSTGLLAGGGAAPSPAPALAAARRRAPRLATDERAVEPRTRGVYTFRRAARLTAYIIRVTFSPGTTGRTPNNEVR